MIEVHRPGGEDGQVALVFFAQYLTTDQSLASRLRRDTERTTSKVNRQTETTSKLGWPNFRPIIENSKMGKSAGYVQNVRYPAAGKEGAICRPA